MFAILFKKGFDQSIIKCVAGLFICLMMLFTSCASSTDGRSKHSFFENNGKIKVLTTTAMINDIAQEIGGDYIVSMPLIKGELDPHSYELVKGDDEKFAAADLIFANGLGLEHGLSLKQNLEHNPKAHFLGDHLLNEKNLIIMVDGQYDPHIWMDIALWMKTVAPLVHALIEKDPSHAEIYRQRAQSLLKKMAEADQWVFESLQAIPDEKRYLVTSHDAFNYFTRHYLATSHEKESGLWKNRFAAPEGLAPDAQLSVADIQEIIDYISKYHICVVFPESNVSKDSLKKILDASKKKGLTLRMSSKTLYGDAMGKEGSEGDTYLKMIEHNARTIREEILNSNEGCHE